MVKSTPFVGDYKLRFTYSSLKALADEFNISSVVDFGSAVGSFKLGESGMIRTLLIGLKALHPMITEDELTREGGLFDQFMDSNDSGYGGIVNDVLIQSLVDCGVLTRDTNPNQVADEGNSQNQLKNG